MNIVTVSGTARPSSNTKKAVEIVNDYLAKQGLNFETIDLAETILYHPGIDRGDSDQLKLQEIIRSADAIIMATPEYHGSFASGVIGAIKSLEHLRSVLSHVGANVLPEVVSIAQVHKVFTSEGELTNDKTKTRLEGLVDKLAQLTSKEIQVAK